jgi:hypothetical protein
MSKTRRFMNEKRVTQNNDPAAGYNSLNMKSSLCLTKHQAMKRYGGVKVQLHEVLVSFKLRQLCAPGSLELRAGRSVCLSVCRKSNPGVRGYNSCQWTGTRHKSKCIERRASLSWWYPPQVVCQFLPKFMDRSALGGCCWYFLHSWVCSSCCINYSVLGYRIAGQLYFTLL